MILKSHPKVIQNDEKVIQKSSKKINENVFKCSFCDKTYKYKQGKFKHEKKCSNKKDINKLEQELDVLKKELLKLINKKCKIICVNKI